MSQKLVKVVAVCLVLTIVSLQGACAQTEQLLLLPGATDVSSVQWKDKVYRFPNFQKGKITYLTGPLEHEFYLNYNLYFEKMDFISSNGDTLNITNTREIKAVQIADKWFLHNYKTGYYEVVLSLPVALALRKQFSLRNLGRKEVGYYTVEREATRAEVRGVVSDHDRFYEITDTYFFVDRENKVHKASRSSVLKLFPNNTAQIKEYLIEHPVNFESRTDLITLLNYCNQFTLGPAGNE